MSLNADVACDMLNTFPDSHGYGQVWEFKTKCVKLAPQDLPHIDIYMQINMNTCVNGRTSPHIFHTLLAGAALVWNSN